MIGEEIIGFAIVTLLGLVSLWYLIKNRDSLLEILEQMKNSQVTFKRES